MLFSLVYFLVGRVLGTGQRPNEGREIELLVLRHQVRVLQRQVKRPVFAVSTGSCWRRRARRCPEASGLRRQARDSPPLAPGARPQEVDIQEERPPRPATDRPRGQRPRRPVGPGESPVGLPAHPRRAAEAGHPGLGDDLKGTETLITPAHSRIGPRTDQARPQELEHARDALNARFLSPQALKSWIASLAADPMQNQSDREPGVFVHDGQKERIPGQRHDLNKCTLQDLGMAQGGLAVNLSGSLAGRDGIGWFPQPPALACQLVAEGNRDRSTDVLADTLVSLDGTPAETDGEDKRGHANRDQYRPREDPPWAQRMSHADNLAGSSGPSVRLGARVPSPQLRPPGAQHRGDGDAEPTSST